MILKIIHDDFELDLSNQEFTVIEENNWLNDKVLSKYTYPIELDLTPEQAKALKNVDEHNLSEYRTLYEVEFNIFGELHDAVLEVESIIGLRATLQVRHGLEDFPNFDLNLRELPLETIDLQVSIFDYAKTIITQTYPAVNFNFPQVITDLIDTESEQWAYFEGIINNYVAGDFLLNEYDGVNDEQINRNVIQPLPYFLHILKTGIEAAGYTVAGDIFEDPEFKKATIFSLSEYYTSFNADQAQYGLNTDDYVQEIGNAKGRYELSMVLPEPGRYKIAGNIMLRGFFGSAYAKLIYNGRTIWGAEDFAFGFHEKFYSIEKNIDFNGNEGDLLFESEQLLFSRAGGVIDDQALIMDLTITQLTAFDVQGNPVPSLITPDKINLPKCVPDQSFGEFVTAFLKWKNYAMDIVGLHVDVSKIEDQIERQDNAFDLSGYEVRFPERKFNQGKTFTLGFFNVDSDEYKFDSIFIDNSGFKTEPYTTNEDTKPITINALPLPLKQRGGIKTAHAFVDDGKKPFVVLYSGLSGTLNLAEDPQALSIINVYENDYVDWIRFLLKSISFTWSFRTYYEKIYSLKVKSIVYAYGQYHIIRRLSRTTRLSQKHGMVVETEVETESLN